MIQLILHLLGDYVTQSDWMANNKTKHWWPALCHAYVYALPFSLIASNKACLVIFGTHYLIDRFRLARYVCFSKNFIFNFGGGNTLAEMSWSDCRATGYSSATPQWIAVWLMIVCDNTIHLAINYASIALF